VDCEQFAAVHSLIGFQDVLVISEIGDRWSFLPADIYVGGAVLLLYGCCDG